MKVIIIGGGQVGTYLATLLEENNHSYTVIENRKHVFDRLTENFSLSSLVFGNGAEPFYLEEAGIADADVVAAVTGADEVNLVVATLAKMEFNIPRVLARVNHPKNAWLFNKGMGVDVAVNQADILAHLVLEEMDLKEMFTLLKLNQGHYSVVQTQVAGSSVAINQEIRNLDIPKEAVLMAVIREGQLLIPKGETRIQQEDEIIALVHENEMIKLESLFQ